MAKAKKDKWMGFTLDIEHGVARAIFEKRYGHPPTSVVQRGPMR